MADILVVDNNKCITELLKEVFGENGHNVQTAQTGMQAQELFNANGFDFAFIDIGLPDINGLDLIPEIKKANPKTKTIIVSGKSDNETIIKSFRCGAEDYLLKPFDIDYLLRLTEPTKNVCKKAYGDEVEASGSFSPQSPKYRRAFIDFILAQILMAVALSIQFLLLPIPDIYRSNLVLNMFFLLASYGCCQAFILVLNEKWQKFIDDGKLKNRAIITITLTHLLFVAVLYFANPLLELRKALAISWLSSIAINYLRQTKNLRSIIAKFRLANEGRHRLVIKLLHNLGGSVRHDKDNSISVSGTEQFDFKSRPAKSIKECKSEFASEDYPPQKRGKEKTTVLV